MHVFGKRVKSSVMYTYKNANLQPNKVKLSRAEGDRVQLGVAWLVGQLVNVVEKQTARNVSFQLTFVCFTLCFHLLLTF